MKIREGFLKTNLGGKPYVLPFGQNIADHCQGIALNETSELLWEGMSDGHSREQLVEKLRKKYQLQENVAGEIFQDVEQFEKQLQILGIAEEEQEEFYGWNPLFFSAGPLKIAYKGPEEVYKKYFQKFHCDSGEAADLTVQIACLPPRFQKNGKVILRNEEIIIMDAGEEYLFIFPSFPVLYEMQVKKDGSYALLFCRGDRLEEGEEDIFHAIRFAFLITASEHHLFLLHSASILYQNKAWLFSGKSGAGKSTHTNLWREMFDVAVLNGDLNMLGIEGNQIFVYGQPWCGTSGICTERIYPLGGITFIRQDGKNYCDKLSREEKLLMVVQRMISPAWEKHLLERNISFAEKVEKYTHIWRLNCTPETGAVLTIKEQIDNSL